MDNLAPMTPQDLLAVSDKIKPVQTYWLDTYFTSVHRADGKTIVIEDIEADTRKLAPMVLADDRGRPIQESAQSTRYLCPGYIKIKDPVVVTAVFNGSLGGLMLSESKMTLAERHDAKRATIVRQHKDAVKRREEYMAANAVIYGEVSLKYEGAQTQHVNFGRHASLTVVLAPGAQLTDPDSDMIEAFQSMIDMIQDKEGGSVDRITVGNKAWSAIRKHPQFKDMMDKNILNSDWNLKRGLTTGDNVATLKGSMDGIPVYAYNDHYVETDETGAKVTRNFMDPRDIVFTSSQLNGVRAYGAIEDQRANFESLPIFHLELDPDRDTGKSEILTQSAPIMIPLNPNASGRMRAVA